MPDTALNTPTNDTISGPKIVFSPDTSATEETTDNFNPLAAVRHAAAQTAPATFSNVTTNVSTSVATPPAPQDDTAGIDVISSTLDMLHQAEQALAEEIHHINSQETSALDEIKTLVDKAKSIEQQEDQLSSFIKRIQDRRSQITSDPDTAHTIAQESWLKALVEQYQSNLSKKSGLPVRSQPLANVPTPPVAPLRSVPKLEPKPVSVPVQEVTPEVTKTPLSVTPSTAAEQKIVTAVRLGQPAERQLFMDNTTHAYRSPDGNGVIMQHGKDTIHVSDAELIQAGLFVDDLAEISPRV